MPVSGFFSSRPAVQHKSRKSKLLEVGGAGDCGFRAVATVLFDNSLNHPRMKPELLNQVLTDHFRLFPQHRPIISGLVTPSQRMQQLMQQVPMRELIPAMAYTLRQIAVDELCANPHLYRGAFVDQHEQTSPAMMRQAGTWIDESSIAALANALATTIEVKVVERNKRLPMRLRYNSGRENKVTNPKIVMQLQDHHYKPFVSSGRFTSATMHHSVRPVQPVADNTRVADRSLQEIHAMIAEEDKRLVTEFENTYNRLATMVAAGELHKHQLLDIYAKNMKNSDYLSGRVKYITLEHGNQDFFEALFGAQDRNNKPQQGDSNAIEDNHEPQQGDDNHDRLVTAEIVHALARAISIDQMSADEVFGQIDEKQAESRYVSAP